MTTEKLQKAKELEEEIKAYKDVLENLINMDENQKLKLFIDNRKIADLSSRASVKIYTFIDKCLEESVKEFEEL
ncbi:MAG: hypothetical protein HUJ71_05915 [Pseudobutyrivibrio sp.]|nr:hypothetical protein [Pseudobutyrivibrio sp.]